MEKVKEYWIKTKIWLKTEKQFTNADAVIIWILILGQVIR